MALTCELCNSTNFVKEEGMFVCQDCGMKYSIEEAKRLIAGGDAPAASGSSSIQEKVANFLTLANNAFNSDNNEEAENYASKVLEIDANNAEAWLIKGEAIGWQSKVANVRFNEMTNCWTHCAENASPEDLPRFREVMKDQATRLIKALVSVNADNFSSNPSQDNLNRLRNCGKTALDTAISLIGLRAPLDLTEINQYMAEKMNSAGVSGSDEADKDYGPDRSDKHIYAYRRWIEQTDYCISLLEVALIYAEKESTINQIVKNLTILQENVIGSCCYKFEASAYSSGYYEDQSLTETAKSIRRRSIEKYKKDAKEKIAKKKAEEEKKRREAQEKRNKEYWDAHAEEKAQLEARKAELTEARKPLDAKIAELDKKLSAIVKKGNAPVPTADELKQLKDRISSLSTKKASLGFFKGKEKKALQAEIDELEAQIPALQKRIEEETYELTSAVDAEAAPVRKELKDVKAELKVITDELDHVVNELTKNR